MVCGMSAILGARIVICHPFHAPPSMPLILRPHLHARETCWICLVLAWANRYDRTTTTLVQHLAWHGIRVAPARLYSGQELASTTRTQYLTTSCSLGRCFFRRDSLMTPQ